MKNTEFNNIKVGDTVYGFEYEDITFVIEETVIDTSKNFIETDKTVYNAYDYDYVVFTDKNKAQARADELNKLDAMDSDDDDDYDNYGDCDEY